MIRLIGVEVSIINKDNTCLLHAARQLINRKEMVAVLPVKTNS